MAPIWLPLMSWGFDHNCKVSACMDPITPKSRGAFDLLNVMKSIRLSSYQSVREVYRQTSKYFKNHMSYQCCNLLHMGAHVVILCSHRDISFMLLLGTEKVSWQSTPWSLVDVFHQQHLELVIGHFKPFLKDVLHLLSVCTRYCVTPSFKCFCR